MTPSKVPARWDVWVLAGDSGCGACVQSIQALQAPRYAALLRHRGVRFARSPRQADVILLTGALSARARAPLHQLLDAVPRPRALVAVGDCAIDGCVFRESSTLLAEPARALGVHVEISGCPPAPTAILDAIVLASRLLAQDSAPSVKPAGQGQHMSAPAADNEMVPSMPSTPSASPATQPARTALH